MLNTASQQPQQQEQQEQQPQQPQQHAKFHTLLSILAGDIDYWRECPDVFAPRFTYITLIFIKIN